MSEKPFFVGYLPVPKALRGFLWVLMIMLCAAGAGLGYVIGAAQDDPGDGAFRFDYGRQTVVGTLELTPLPILHVTEGTDRVAAGTTLLLSGQGKQSILSRATPLGGQVVQASGVLLERGDLQMMQLRGGNNGLRAAEGAGVVPDAQPLGRWRLAGEICDGKCYAGAMRPGTGLSHKACANLCLLGDIPPVFVSSQPVEGAEFLLVVGPNGQAMAPELLHHVAQFVQLSGDIRRHGDLLVFAADPGSVEVLP